MATRITCDICGETLKGRPQKLIVIHDHNTRAEVSLDLCYRCGGALRGVGEVGRYSLTKEFMAEIALAVETVRNKRADRLALGVSE